VAGRSLAFVAVTFTMRERPLATMTSSAACPGLRLRTSRSSRSMRDDATLQSPTSPRGSRTSTPLMLAIRSPSTRPAFSAGPPATTDCTNTPTVSRALPVLERYTPTAALSSFAHELVLRHAGHLRIVGVLARGLEGDAVDRHQPVSLLEAGLFGRAARRHGRDEQAERIAPAAGIAAIASIRVMVVRRIVGILMGASSPGRHRPGQKGFRRR
jgi:hypothetical protein